MKAYESWDTSEFETRTFSQTHDSHVSKAVDDFLILIFLKYTILLVKMPKVIFYPQWIYTP